MSYEQSRSEVQRSHTLSMENRDKLSLTGVEAVSYTHLTLPTSLSV